nr:DNA translocase FtsK [Lachnospiraceae bacterium]
ATGEISSGSHRVLPGAVTEPQEEPRQETLPQGTKPVSKYVTPPITLLKKGKSGPQGDSAQELKATAANLQKTLESFGVNAKVTDISQGPAVTRYELQPEIGVKVSRIVNLADDIKLNLAATDIRIEAPIPGKAAVGIEVPNKSISMVAFRDLIESKEYRASDARLTFAVGKDIAGRVIVTDLAKMPHLLIAGATGSGKSVCINTIIMSILYKAKPDEVKLIMIDPKVVELSVYNGIPHLLLPVVTDPKKAAGSLQWAVKEMTDRYQKFADTGVRDLKGYNQHVEELQASGEQAPEKMPQILIIVDELADLMMVASNEVEEAICRLAQLARAAGIHLIIATQRPSVDVITGLIKANMPSRIAFAVSSGVDSRTILDSNGAEKLLGKGDMLFDPQGYPKPLRVQGAFISDDEVAGVVEFLKAQDIINDYGKEIEAQIQTVTSSGDASSAGGASGSSFGNDELFTDAGKFVIEKDKASIGMLQRVFKIGFNRAARIMDQLCEAGVVSEEDGTKPRKVLMSAEQFENYLEEYGG